MRTFLIILLCAFVLLAAGNLQAQGNEPKPILQFLQQLPIPLPALKDMMVITKTYDAVENEFSKAYNVMLNQASSLYRPIYERYKKAVANDGSVRLSAAEQTMMLVIKQSSKGLSDDLQFDVFKMQMLNRPLVGNGRPVWASVAPSPGSSSAITVYQQLKTLEAGFDWKAFRVGAESYLPKFGAIDKSLLAINAKFNADLQNLPQKKIRAPEGFTYETQDPEKAIPLWQQHGVQKQKTFEQRYAVLYAWWIQQYKKLNAICDSLDALALQVNDDDTGTMHTLKQLLADLQLRTLEAFYTLTGVSQQLYHDAMIAVASEQQVKEAITMYKQMQQKE